MPGSDHIDDLIARAQQGEIRAFEQLVASHVPQLRRFARAFIASDSDADDLAQEALIKVYRSIKLFRHQAAFSTWLYAVARNVFLDFTRSRAGHERAREESLEVAHTEHLAGDVAADAHLEQEQERERVWRALRQLPVDYRTALVLFDLEGRSYDEVAAIEGVPIGTIRSRLSRGRAQLKVLLDEADARERRTVEARGAEGTLSSATSSHVRRSGS